VHPYFARAATWVVIWDHDQGGGRQAENLSKQIGDQSGVAYALYSLGDVSTAEGSLSAALDYYIESITLRTQIGEKGNIEESQMALALLQFEEGDAIGAENSLRAAREEFRKEGIGDEPSEPI